MQLFPSEGNWSEILWLGAPKVPLVVHKWCSKKKRERKEERKEKKKGRMKETTKGRKDEREEKKSKKEKRRNSLWGAVVVYR